MLAVYAANYPLWDDWRCCILLCVCRLVLDSPLPLLLYVTFHRISRLLTYKNSAFFLQSLALCCMPAAVTIYAYLSPMCSWRRMCQSSWVVWSELLVKLKEALFTLPQLFSRQPAGNPINCLCPFSFFFPFPFSSFFSSKRISCVVLTLCSTNGPSRCRVEKTAFEYCASISINFDPLSLQTLVPLIQLLCPLRLSRLWRKAVALLFRLHQLQMSGQNSFSLQLLYCCCWCSWLANCKIYFSKVSRAEKT